MDAKAIDLALLAALSVLCAMIAWQSDRDVVGSLFFALGAVAMIGAGYTQQRR
jgi:Flp pilus assembly pilin Flp